MAVTSARMPSADFGHFESGTTFSTGTTGRSFGTETPPLRSPRDEHIEGGGVGLPPRQARFFSAEPTMKFFDDFDRLCEQHLSKPFGCESSPLREKEVTSLSSEDKGVFLWNLLQLVTGFHTQIREEPLVEPSAPPGARLQRKRMTIIRDALSGLDFAEQRRMQRRVTLTRLDMASGRGSGSGDLIQFVQSGSSLKAGQQAFGESALLALSSERAKMPTSPSGSAGVKEQDELLITEDDWEGIQAINQYTILDKLGSGTQGTVFLGYDEQKREFRAIKAIKKPMATSASMEQLKCEIEIMKKIRHRNVVALYEVINAPTSKTIYLVMQYVESGPIITYLASKDQKHCVPHTAEKFLYLARQVASGLAYLHSLGIYHHDIKPENILLGADDNVFLSDFGVAQMVGAKTATFLRERREELGASSSLAESLLEADLLSGNSSTNAPAARGTPAYFAPEKVRKKKSLSGREAAASDVWALGMTFYFLLCGSLPFMMKEDQLNGSSVKTSSTAVSPHHGRVVMASQPKQQGIEELVDECDETRVPHQDPGDLRGELSLDSTAPGSPGGSLCISQLLQQPSSKKVQSMAESIAQIQPWLSTDESVRWAEYSLRIQKEVISFPPDLPQCWQDIITRMLTRSVHKRISAAELVTKLDTVNPLTMEFDSGVTAHSQESPCHPPGFVERLRQDLNRKESPEPGEYLDFFETSDDEHSRSSSPQPPAVTDGSGGGGARSIIRSPPAQAGTAGVGHDRPRGRSPEAKKEKRAGTPTGDNKKERKGGGVKAPPLKELDGSLSVEAPVEDSGCAECSMRQKNRKTSEAELSLPPLVPNRVVNGGSQQQNKPQPGRSPTAAMVPYVPRTKPPAQQAHHVRATTVPRPPQQLHVAGSSFSKTPRSGKK